MFLKGFGVKKHEYSNLSIVKDFLPEIFSIALTSFGKNDESVLALFDYAREQGISPADVFRRLSASRRTVERRFME